jgi:hypothetical protein
MQFAPIYKPTFDYPYLNCSDKYHDMEIDANTSDAKCASMIGFIRQLKTRNSFLPQSEDDLIHIRNISFENNPIDEKWGPLAVASQIFHNMYVYQAYRMYKQIYSNEYAVEMSGWIYRAVSYYYNKFPLTSEAYKQSCNDTLDNNIFDIPLIINDKKRNIFNYWLKKGNIK